MKNISIVAKIGLLSGFLFFAHALIPNSNAWPLLWPILGGVFLILFQRNQDGLKNFSHAAKSLFKVGLLSATVFFVLTILVLYLLGLPELEKASAFLGADGGIILTSSVITGLIIASGLGTAFSVVFGSALYPFVKK